MIEQNVARATFQWPPSRTARPIVVAVIGCPLESRSKLNAGFRRAHELELVEPDGELAQDVAVALLELGAGGGGEGGAAALQVGRYCLAVRPCGEDRPVGGLDRGLCRGEIRRRRSGRRRQGDRRGRRLRGGRRRGGAAPGEQAGARPDRAQAVRAPVGVGDAELAVARVIGEQRHAANDGGADRGGKYDPSTSERAGGVDVPSREVHRGSLCARRDLCRDDRERMLFRQADHLSDRRRGLSRPAGERGAHRDVGARHLDRQLLRREARRGDRSQVRGGDGEGHLVDPQPHVARE